MSEPAVPDQKRMETARRLLRETAVSVVAIANEVGYANPSHFAQLFRKGTGFTPSGVSSLPEMR